MSVDRATPTAGEDARQEVLRAVRSNYLDSGDYNGLYVGPDTPLEIVQAVSSLVRDHLIQVVSERDFVNPHIRPWPSRRSAEEQVQSVEAITTAEYGVCLYPTPRGMRGVRLPRRLTGRPYERAVARGQGVLELAFFEFEVLGTYRDDPRYRFDFDDFGADMSVSDEVYFDANEPERDKVSLQHIGFAYDLSDYDRSDPASPITRRVAVFVGDLARLTDEHQQRWKTHEVPSTGLGAHPVWWGIQMGNWPDGCGPFHRMLFEMENINALWRNSFGTTLFRTTDRPREFGWLLRPSKSEWDMFVHQLDKLLSENLDAKALDSAGAPRKDERDQQIGSLGRLQEFMLRHRIAPEAARTVMQPFRDVRSERQGPAHALSENITDRTFVHQQVALLERINDSLSSIRNWLVTHPKNRTLTLPHDDDSLGREYRM